MPVALSIFGLPEGWSIAVVFLAGMIAVPIGFFCWITADNFITDRRIAAGRDFAENESPWHGTILCDYVDESRLATIAAQHDIEPQPDRRERGSSASREGELSIVARVFGGKWRGQRQHDEREIFENIEKIPDVVLSAVLDKLQDRDALDRSVEYEPVLGTNPQQLETMIRDIKQGDESVDELRARLLGGEKRRELQALVERNPFLLIDSEWGVTREGGWENGEADFEITLSLEKLKPSPYDRARHAVGDQQSVPMPEGVSVVVTARAVGRNAARAGRLTDGATVHAAVLATVAAYDQELGELSLLPISIFGRIGAQDATGRPYAMGVY